MAGAFHEDKLAARAQLHEAMSRAAIYYPDPDDLGTSQEVDVRVHSRMDTLGEMKGTSFDFAERADVVPRVVFDNRAVTPQHNAVVSLGNSEAYQVDMVEPKDAFTSTATAPRLPEHKAANFPGPGE